MRITLFWVFGIALCSSVALAQAPAGIPVFAVTPEESTITFAVDASVPIQGSFDDWDTSVTFASPDVTTGVLNTTIQAASVNTGSGIKNNKLKSQDFFDVQDDPVITFKSTKFTQTGPDTFQISGIFTIRGVSKPEKLLLKVSGKGTGSGEIKGTMAFDRRDYGMNSSIPFIKIADRVAVTVDVKVKRTSGPPLVFQE